MRHLISVVALCLIASHTYASDPKSAIENVLTTQQDAWNHHDLNAFMSGYWSSPDLTFFSGKRNQRLAGYARPLSRDLCQPRP